MSLQSKTQDSSTGLDVSQIENYLLNKDLSVEKLSEQIKLVNIEIETLSSQGKYSSPEFINSTKKLNKLNDINNLLSILIKDLDNYKQALEMLKDEDLAEIALNDINSLNIIIETEFQNLKKLTVKPLKNDEKKALIEIRPGVGGVEASLFAEELLRAYTRFLTANNYSFENVTLDYDPEGGIREAVLQVNTEGSYGALRFESGVHRVQRVPKTESAGRIHTSAISVAVLPKFDANDIQIDSKDLRIDVFRSGGPGGQSVNTTDSAVRITHLPTGIVVSCQSGKSQHQNKDTAMGILYSKLKEIEEEKQTSETNEIRLSSIKDADRSAKIRTYNFPQGRVTDHRIGKSWFNIVEIMNGEMEEVITTVSTVLREELE